MKLKYFLLLTLTFLIFSNSPAEAFLGSFFSSALSSKSATKVKFIQGDESADDEVLLVRIKGVIQEQSNTEQFSLSMEKDLMDEVRKDIDTAKKRSAIKAILLEINSPGGEVTAGDIIYNWINKFKEETKKPVVAIFGSLGASGAYYVACAADEIYAHPTSLVGSIGAILQSMNIERLSQNLGIKPLVIKSERTPSKDLLSPYRDMTEAEHKLLSEIVNEMYDRFVSIVAKSRKMTTEEVEKIADGSLCSATKALKNGLIDAIGYREDAFEKAYKLAGVDSAALVSRETSKSLLQLLSSFNSRNDAAVLLLNEIRSYLNSHSTLLMQHR